MLWTSAATSLKTDRKSGEGPDAAIAMALTSALVLEASFGRDDKERAKSRNSMRIAFMLQNSYIKHHISF